MWKSNRLPDVSRVFCAGALLGLAGCGGIKVVPVSGKALVDGTPLTRGVINFNPDPAKGNTARIACRGRIKGDGQYELFTDDGSDVTKGAPVGWYKVTIATTPGDDTPLPVHGRYSEFTQTDIEIEVGPNAGPGAYDLKFTK
jgi:hypothetical protein